MSAIDLSLLPPPTIVETLSAETIIAAMIADLQARDPAFSALVESDPAYKIIEACAFREVLIRQRVNDAAKGVMLAYAVGADLDNLAALYSVARLTITPATPDTVPPTAAVMESDTALRARLILAMDGQSAAGPVGLYRFWSLSVPDVVDCSVTSPLPGQVVVTVLGRGGDGTVLQAVIDAESSAITSEDVRTLTDNVIVQNPTVVPFSVNATLTVLAGPDAATVLAAARAGLAAYLANNRLVGRDITRAGLIASLFAAGVQNVALTSPPTDVVVSDTQFANCTGTVVAIGGTGG